MFSRILQNRFNSADRQNCRQLFYSSNNKTGQFETTQQHFSYMGYPSANILNGASASAFGGRFQCRYEFHGEGFERVQIKFLSFNIPTQSRNASDCKLSDSLQLLVPMRGKFEATDLFCGAFLPKPIMSTGQDLFLQFSGRYSTNVVKTGYYGFKAEYRFLTNFGIVTGEQQGDNCTFVYNSTQRKSGWISSPNFPGMYPQNIICNYLFYGEPEEIVIINFTYFDVEGIGTCEYLTASDYVEFSNFISMDRKFERYCGRRDKFEIRSDARFFRITFVSNDRFDKSGFRALYDFETRNIPVENSSMQSYYSSDSNQNIAYWNLRIRCIFALYLIKFCG